MNIKYVEIQQNDYEKDLNRFVVVVVFFCVNKLNKPAVIVSERSHFALGKSRSFRAIKFKSPVEVASLSARSKLRLRC